METLTRLVISARNWPNRYASHGNRNYRFWSNHPCSDQFQLESQLETPIGEPSLKIYSFVGKILAKTHIHASIALFPDFENSRRHNLSSDHSNEKCFGDSNGVARVVEIWDVTSRPTVGTLWTRISAGIPYTGTTFRCIQNDQKPPKVNASIALWSRQWIFEI